MRDLILVRHGESEHHINGLTGGWTNTSLTKLGQKQALLTGQRLSSLFSCRSIKFHCSDLDRALETAQIIGKIIGVEPRSSAKLRELNWGIAIDMTLEEAHKLELEKTDPLIDWVPFPEAESRRKLFERISTFLTEIKAMEMDIVLIVSHGNAIETCIWWFLELPLTLHSRIAFDIDPCSITHLRINDWNEKTIALLNSTEHLLSLNSET